MDGKLDRVFDDKCFVYLKNKFWVNMTGDGDPEFDVRECVASISCLFLVLFNVTFQPARPQMMDIHSVRQQSHCSSYCDAHVHITQAVPELRNFLL